MHCSLDTSILIRAITGDLPDKRAKVMELLSRDDIRCEVSDLAITETVYVLTRLHGYSREAVVKKLGFLLGLECVDYNRPLFDAVFPMFLLHPKLSFNDCCLGVYARLSSAEPLYTFDRKLANQIDSATEL